MEKRKVFFENLKFATSLSICDTIRPMAKKKTQDQTISAGDIEKSIHVIRGNRVMLDSDLAKLYGVRTSALNQAVKRNSERFPEDFAYQLTQQEFTALMSQNVTSKSGRGGRTKSPWVFTEQGVAMLSSVLQSATAAKVNVEIMRTFVRLRRLMATPGELVEQLTKLAETVQWHDEQIRLVRQVLQQMLEQPEKPKRSIGFNRPDDES